MWFGWCADFPELVRDSMTATTGPSYEPQPSPQQPSQQPPQQPQPTPAASKKRKAASTGELLAHKPAEGDYHIKTLKGFNCTVYGLGWPGNVTPTEESLKAQIAPFQLFKVTAINDTHATLVPHVDNTGTFKIVNNAVLKKSKPKPGDYDISPATSIEVEAQKFEEGKSFCAVVPAAPTPHMACDV